jgi:hypothetical protein
MIRTVTGYGIDLTQEFGDPFPGYEKLVNLIHRHYHHKIYVEYYSQNPKYPKYEPQGDYDYLGWLIESPWLCVCPGGGQWQIALGFETVISRKTNFDELDEQWHELMQQLPEKIAKEVQALGLNTPDVIEMSGKC